MYKVNGELSSCDITYSGRVLSREGVIHNFALLLNGLSKSAQTFTVGFVKLLSTHPIHIVVRGNFPFKFIGRARIVYHVQNLLILPRLKAESCQGVQS